MPAKTRTLALSSAALLLGLLAGCGEADGGSPGGGGSGAAHGGADGTANGGGGSGGSGGDAPASAPFVYVGGTDGNISVYELDEGAKALTFRSSLAAGAYPSFLAVDPKSRTLYAVLEADAEVAAFAIDEATGALAERNRLDSGGGAPAHVSLDRSGRTVLVANYEGGTVRAFPIKSDGALGEATDTESAGVNPHMTITAPGDRFAFVPMKGSDAIAQFVFDADAGTLEPNAVPEVATAAGAGPRHLAFHPDGAFAYGINELDDTMNAYAFDAEAGTLTEVQSLSTLPSGSDGDANTCAEVHVAPSGRFVYGSNRGDDSIVVFALDPGTGKMAYVAHDPSGGATPRHFMLHPSGRFMVAANRDSNRVVLFEVSEKTGRLTFASEVTVDTPEYAGFVLLPR